MNEPRHLHAVPPEAEPTTVRERDDADRLAAREANGRDYAAPSAETARVAIGAAIAALAPIADDRESIARVLDALEALFRPVALAPGKDTAQILNEVLAEPVVQALIPALLQFAIASQTPKTEPAKDCADCARKARRPTDTIVTPPSGAPVPEPESGARFVVHETTHDVFYAVDAAGTLAPFPRDASGLPPALASLNETNARAIMAACARAGMRTVEILPLA